MSAEYYLVFSDPQWLIANLVDLERTVAELETFMGRELGALLLLGTEHRNAPGRARFDVRLLPRDDATWLVEISAHPASVTRDLFKLFAWVKARTEASVVDDDGLVSTWDMGPSARRSTRPDHG